MAGMVEKFDAVMKATSLAKEGRWKEAAEAWDDVERISDREGGKAVARQYAAECRQMLQN